MQDQRIIAMSIARCVGNVAQRAYPPQPALHDRRDRNAAAMQAALAAAPLVTLYKRYVVGSASGTREKSI